jgi:outer membrane protein OmpA-like peptidoglycan-associated protein
MIRFRSSAGTDRVIRAEHGLEIEGPDRVFRGSPEGCFPRRSAGGGVRWVASFAGIAMASWLQLGCGAAVAPQQLHNARHAYNQASQGPAARLAPAQLDTARQSLERANVAFQSGADESIVIDRAYIAERHVAIAVSAAGLEQANRNIASYDKQGKELRRKLQHATQAELLRMKRELENRERENERLAANVEAEREARLAAEKKAAAALKSLEEVARVKEESRGIVITLSGAVLFATGKYTLLPIAKSKLQEVAKALLEQGDSDIVIEGHTDSRGSDDKNQELSLRRAEEVRGYLVSQGIPTNSVKAVGRGEENPVADNDTAEGRANNRRVEIIVKPRSGAKPKT